MSLPLVSILLPTYNRARFLPAACESIRSQSYPNWELVVVDDGSTDATCDLVSQFHQTVPQSVRYTRQENEGVYSARLKALSEARGDHVAFFDSDDLWLPHHLSDGVDALAAHPRVGWVYGACRMQDADTGKVLEDSTFYPGGQARPFLRLRARAEGRLRIIDDPRTWDVAVTAGLFSGLQCSVIRRSVFAAAPFRKRYPMRIGEDVAMIMMALKTGCTFAYYDAVHTIYRVHDQNTSAAGGIRDVDRQLAREYSMAEGWEAVGRDLGLSADEWRSVRRALGEAYFWRIGYALLWENGRRREALEAFRKGLGMDPWSPGRWKTYLLSRIRTWFDSGTPTPPRVVA